MSVAALLFTALACGPARREDIAFFKVQFEGNRGWIVGGLTYRTDDAGKTWNQLPWGWYDKEDISPWPRKNMVAFVDSQRAYNTLTGSLLATSDGGTTWSSVTKELHGRVFFSEDGTWGFAEAPGETRVTTDGGQTWRGTQEFGVEDVCFLSNSEAYVAWLDKVWHTTDKGSTVTPVLQFADQRITKLRADGSSLWILGDLQLCRRYDTASGEVESFDLNLPDYPDFSDLLVTTTHVFVAGGGGVYSTPRVKVDWRKVLDAVVIMSLAETPDGHLFAVGSGRRWVLTERPVAFVCRDGDTWCELALPGK